MGRGSARHTAPAVAREGARGIARERGPAARRTSRPGGRARRVAARTRPAGTVGRGGVAAADRGAAADRRAVTGVRRTRLPRAGVRLRRVAGLVAALSAAVSLAVAGVVAAAGPAQATGYRYWSYWLRSGGAWTYAQTGPAMHVPRDGDVEGWRFAVSRDAAAEAVQPRGTADFAAICGGTPAAHGRKRVALVIDPGTPADAPGGQPPPAPRTACARIDSGASSADALAAVAAPLRYDSSGILCAISGYPRTGCGEEVSSSGSGSGSGSRSGAGKASAAGAEPKGGGGPSVGVYAGLAAVLALGGAAFWQSRRNRR